MLHEKVMRKLSVEQLQARIGKYPFTECQMILLFLGYSAGNVFLDRYSLTYIRSKIVECIRMQRLQTGDGEGFDASVHDLHDLKNEIEFILSINVNLSLNTCIKSKRLS